MNNVELIGRLTRDPKMYNGIAKITLAIDRPTKEKRTDYPTVTVFGKQAENVCKYMKKGSTVAIQGSVQTGSYDKNGEMIYTTDIVANRVEFIGSSKKQAETEDKQATVDFEELDVDQPF